MQKYTGIVSLGSYIVSFVLIALGIIGLRRVKKASSKLNCAGWGDEKKKMTFILYQRRKEKSVCHM